MNISEITGHPEWEQVLYCEDDRSGLKAIIAVHSTTLGPAAGGCRMYPYANFDDALTDALRLSRGMTYKNAAAGLDLGGGKSVIIGNPATDKSPELMRAFGRFVDSLSGAYYTAEDVGTSVGDIEQAGEVTRYAVGLSKGEYASGDPSPFTARGVFLSMQAAWETIDPRGLSRATVAIQGLGHVGRYLAEYLHRAGAKLVVADINETATAAAAQDLGATVVAPDTIHSYAADIYAPCAMGGALTPQVIDALRARLVCGAANNQLAGEDSGARLQSRGILYAPDYVVNSGGIINVASEIFRISEPDWVSGKIDGLAAFTAEILAKARQTGVTPAEVADQLVQARLSRADSVAAWA